MPFCLWKLGEDSLQLGSQTRRGNRLCEKTQPCSLLGALFVKRCPHFSYESRPGANLLTISNRLRPIWIVQVQKRRLGKKIGGARSAIYRVRATAIGMIRISLELG